MDWARQINIKNPAEIAIMREAGRINATVLAAVREQLKPGVSTPTSTRLPRKCSRNTGPFHPSKATVIRRSKLHHRQH